jgi:hypothetical protein
MEMQGVYGLAEGRLHHRRGVLAGRCREHLLRARALVALARPLLSGLLLGLPPFPVLDAHACRLLATSDRNRLPHRLG